MDDTVALAPPLVVVPSAPAPSPRARMPPLSPWQQMVWDSQKKDWILFAGRRKGKSRVCWQRGVQYCVNGKTTAWYCANKNLANENWGDVVAYCRPFATTVNEVNEGLMTFVHPSKGIGRFKRRSGWNESAGRAGKVNFLILDEGQLMTKKLFNRTRPSLLTTMGHTAITMTPPEDPAEFRQAQWLKDIVDASDDQGNCSLPGWNKWLVTKSPTTPEDVAFVLRQEDLTQGITRPLEWYTNAAVDALAVDRDLMGEEDYNREYNLYWGLPANVLVYDNVRLGVHCREDYDYIPTADVFWAIDRGEGFAYSVVGFINRVLERTVAGVKIWRYRFFDEVSTRAVLTEDELIGMALERSREKNYKLPKLVFYDPRAARVGVSCAGAGLASYTCNVKIEEGIRAVRRTINKRLFEFHPRCKLLLQNVQAYRRDDEGEPVDANNDAADMARYGVVMSEKLDGNLNSAIAENREIVAELGGSSGGAMLLTL